MKVTNVNQSGNLNLRSAGLSSLQEKVETTEDAGLRSIIRMLKVEVEIM